MDGIATLQKLKADDRTRHIPVIMVTALNLDTQVSMCLDQGAIDHIAKPFSNLVVRTRVRALLQNRRPMLQWTIHGPNVRRGSISRD